MNAVESIPFEQAMSELEEIVQQLEAGTLSLEETVAVYQRGRLLAQHCQELLDTAELRVRQLTRDGDCEDGTLPFAMEES